MPSLPTITVTDTQMARITAAFPGATQAEKVEAYRVWLKGQVRREVIRSETAALEEQHTQQMQQIWASVEQDIP